VGNNLSRAARWIEGMREDLQAANSSPERYLESLERAFSEDREALTVLRDRLFSALAFVACVVGELEDGITHEDATEFVCRTYEAIRLTDTLDNTDRSKAGWELDAETRRATLALVTPRVRKVQP
jgi:hypothetical protein